MCEKGNGLIWDAVGELLNRVMVLEGDLVKEVASLKTADDDLSVEITRVVSDEVLLREAADDDLSVEITRVVSDEVLLREAADGVLSAKITSEVSDEEASRQKADKALSEAIILLKERVQALEN